MIIPLKRDVFEKDLKKKKPAEIRPRVSLITQVQGRNNSWLASYICRPLNFIFILKFSKQHMYMYVEMYNYREKIVKKKKTTHKPI